MTTDPTPLRERIARAVWEVCAEPFTPTISHASANEVAISILPIIAAEVRNAQADAWGEGWKHAQKVFRAGGTGPRTRNPYETEDQT